MYIYINIIIIIYIIIIIIIILLKEVEYVHKVISSFYDCYKNFVVYNTITKDSIGIHMYVYILYVYYFLPSVHYY